MDYEHDIQGVGFPKIGGYGLATNKTPTLPSELGWDPDLKRIIFGDGATSQILPTQKDLDKIKLFRGEFSAKAGALPTKDNGIDGRNKGVDLEPGCVWFITEAGTIAGIKGDVDLKVGAFLYMLGSAATVATSFFGQNNDEDTSSFLVDGSTTKDVTGGAETLFAPPAKIKRIVSYSFETSTGVPLLPEIIKITRSGAGIGVSIKTLATRTGVVAYFTGASV